MDALLDHTPEAIQTRCVTPEMANPGSQLYSAIDWKVVEVRSTAPLAGADRGPQSTAEMEDMGRYALHISVYKKWLHSTFQ